MVRQDWLIAYLYVPSSSGKENQPIDPIRIMKGLFLLRMEAKEELPEFYEFEPYLYGPCSFGVYRDLTSLVANGHVDEFPAFPSRWNYYRLTGVGCERARGVLDSLPSHLVEKMTSLKQLVTGMSFLNLLRYVYERYPDYATRSIITLPTGGRWR
jgi:hypothetical protein